MLIRESEALEGSVKLLRVLKKPTPSSLGLGDFIFSDRYSVFDWGPMPDLIPRKGEALCVTSAKFFEELEERGIETHYLGLVEGEKLKSTEELEAPTRTMRIKVARVYKPARRAKAYDYSVFRRLRKNFLIPLEFIYRNTLPPGSSVFRRLERGELTLEELGLESLRPGEELPRPLLDISTKFEGKDRYLRKEEAIGLANLSREELDEIGGIVERTNRLLTELVGGSCLKNEDGKLEFAFNEQRKPIVVDAVGTPDECRFSLHGIEVSKELLRKYYRKISWGSEVEKAKQKAEGLETDWRKLCPKPPALPESFKSLVSQLYQSFANSVLGWELFDVPKLEEVVERLRAY